MTVRRVFAVYFSATGNTKRLTEKLAMQLSDVYDARYECIDFTLPAARAEGVCHRFTSGDLIVLGMPTYAGKLPNKILPFVRSGFAGGGAAAAALVTYGNRSFDHALAELQACLTENGFEMAGAGAFPAQHAFAWDEPERMAEQGLLGSGRPDEEDLAALAAFGDALVRKLHNADPAGLRPVDVPGDADGPYYRPRGLDGEPKQFLKAKPATDPARCDRCGLCAKVCPMGAVSETEPSLVPGTCIKCHACVKSCPHRAKYFNDTDYLSHRKMLERDFRARREPVWFV